MPWGLPLFAIRKPALIVRIFVVAELGFEQSLEDCRNLAGLGVVPIVSERQRQVVAAPFDHVTDNGDFVGGDFALLVAGERRCHVLMVIARPYELGMA